MLPRSEIVRFYIERNCTVPLALRTGYDLIPVQQNEHGTFPNGNGVVAIPGLIYCKLGLTANCNCIAYGIHSLLAVFKQIFVYSYCEIYIVFAGRYRIVPHLHDIKPLPIGLYLEWAGYRLASDELKARLQVVPGYIFPVLVYAAFAILVYLYPEINGILFCKVYCGHLLTVVQHFFRNHRTLSFIPQYGLFVMKFRFTIYTEGYGVCHAVGIAHHNGKISQLHIHEFRIFSSCFPCDYGLETGAVPAYRDNTQPLVIEHKCFACRVSRGHDLPADSHLCYAASKGRVCIPGHAAKGEVASAQVIPEGYI